MKNLLKGHINSVIRKGICLGSIIIVILSFSGCFLIPKEEVVIARLSRSLQRSNMIILRLKKVQLKGKLHVRDTLFRLNKVI
ncbi:hypothetical protein Bccel_0886 [Pseudobacteroides cellulosolvens ATCC 35603 = DSM 2933]|uniref:Lipoprotein n=1 Tax=Pseudobacteroides cellulosolvens ATCC 35603 = DSM 2933 TaxID=398512 RepID=A0A0L6JIE1_9FIRM|nr:hypothetical protein Bccel_0886 [Pseudobacteroides cellulosolvens ATCC 35603 = DSM 2933]